ncbi:MAG: hypothetical protein FD123_3016 [Bacteroidetes bacterium]|nr:MAG: hypothetical protein FD123_3016 [Bacteroidota bacterium]
MIIKRLSLLLLAVFFNLSASFAQQKTDKAEVREGPEAPMSKTNTLEEVIGHDANGYYVTRYARKKRLLEHINTDLKTDKSIEIPLKMEYNGMKRNYDEIIMAGKNLYMFSYTSDRKTKMNYFFVQKISRELEIDPNPTVLFENDFDSDIGGRYGVPFTVSDDQTRILFYRGKGSEEIKNKQMIFTVYDENMKKLWEREVEIPYAADLFLMDNIRIDNDGNIYLTGKEYQEREERRLSRREGKPSYKYHMVSFRDQAKKTKTYDFELDQKFITDIRIGIAANGDLVAAGLYSDKGSYSVKGAFYMLVDGETRQVKKQKSTEFELDFITQNMSDREKKKRRRDFACGTILYRSRYYNHHEFQRRNKYAHNVSLLL